MKGILDQVGVGGNRVEMYNMSSAMGKRWAEVCTEMTERIKALGPNPVRAAKSRESRSPDPVGGSREAATEAVP